MKTEFSCVLEEEKLQEAYKIFFGTLVSTNRLKILNLIRDKELCVNEIVEKSGIEQTHISHDLARLKRCGFIEERREGKYRYYSINEETIKPLLEVIDKHMKGNCIHILEGGR